MSGEAEEEVDPFGCFGSEDGSDGNGNDDSSDRGDDGDCQHHDDDEPLPPPVGDTSTPSGSRRAGSAGRGGTGGDDGTSRSRRKKRDGDCGVLSYHRGTESALLAHVRNAVRDLPPPTSIREGGGRSDGTTATEEPGGAAPAAAGRRPDGSEGEGRRKGSGGEPPSSPWEGSPADVASRTVLSAVDDFCRTRHWMMHVGPDKGSIMSGALRASVEECVAAYHRRRAESNAAAGAASASASASSSEPRRKFVAVELGTYCGYASVLLGRSLKAAASAAASPFGGGDRGGGGGEGGGGDSDGGSSSCPIEFNLYTVEVNPTYASVSRELIRSARLDDLVTVIDIPLDVDVMRIEDAAGDAVARVVWSDEAEARRNNFLWDESDGGRERGRGRGRGRGREDGAVVDAGGGGDGGGGGGSAADAAATGGSTGTVSAAPYSDLPQIDFLFIDHDKDAYLPDLRRLEKEGLVRAGTTVVADNVIFARIDDYLAYVKKLAADGTVATETIMSRMEYADEEDDDGDEDDDKVVEDAEASEDGTSSDLFCDGMEVTKYLASPISRDESWLVRSAPRFAAMKLRGGEEKANKMGEGRRLHTTGSVRMNSAY